MSELDEPKKDRLDEKALRQKVMEAMGAASMCWEPIPTGVFDASGAIAVAERLLAEITPFLRERT